ncbi:MerC domain-containing protein [Gayadomonas joobiniege]|uniref:MerC domain-containing protein n=1 Tax=Gayadomonas joobiniege TaxID=1234606 RepID=UPI000378FF8D|nr:MerC domain-containing protein [Gayadomonas joobiniege]
MRISNFQFLDKVSIGASTICAIHCAVLPILLAVFPSLSFLPSNDHLFHQALVFMIVPMSLLAGFSGCRKHKDKWVAGGIIAGLMILVVAAIFGHDLFGESGEKTATVLASVFLACAHWRNFLLCRKTDCNEDACHSH